MGTGTNLAGEIGTKDAKGHDLFECFLCNEQGDISKGDWEYVGVRSYRVCWKCQRQAIVAALKTEIDRRQEMNCNQESE